MYIYKKNDIEYFLQDITKTIYIFNNHKNKESSIFSQITKKKLCVKNVKMALGCITKFSNRTIKSARKSTKTFSTSKNSIWNY